MATIFAYPNTTGSGNCAILAPQENFYIPFLSNVGNWTQLRVAAYLSLCGSGGFQSQNNTESINLTAPNLGFYWGIGTFSTSFGYVTPQSVGCNFIGLSTFPSGSLSLLQVSNQGNGMAVSKAVGAGSSIYPMVSNNASVFGAFNGSIFSLPPLFQQTGGTGSTNYCVANTLVFTIFNKGLTGQFIAMNNAYDITGGSNLSVFSSFTDPGALRISAMNLGSTGGQPSLSLYYTTGCSPTGGPLPIPDTMYIHSPFNNNLLRVHTVLIEKYY